MAGERNSARCESDIEPGEELEPIEYVITQDMVEFHVEAIGAYHPFYIQDSPWGGPIASPTFAYIEKQMLLKHNAPGGVGPTARVHTEYSAENISPRKVGERVRVHGRCAAKFLRRNREYVVWEAEAYGEDGRLLSRYRDTALLSYRKQEE